jgi:hypothetical protein
MTFVIVNQILVYNIVNFDFDNCELFFNVNSIFSLLL